MFYVLYIWTVFLKASTMPEASSNSNNTDSHLSSLTAGFRDRLGFSQSQV